MDAGALHCRNAPTADPGYVNIGSSDLIDKRARLTVVISPGGTLNDYVPFYFTPYSPMLLNIHTGRGVPKRPNSEIVIFVSSIHRLAEMGLPFVLERKLRIFDERLLDLALTRLKTVSG